MKLFEKQKKIKDLCEQCYYREQGRQACIEFLKICPDGKGMVCDCEPKAECKDHELYGCKIGNRTVCRDFRRIEPSEKAESLMKTGIPIFITDFSI